MIYNCKKRIIYPPKNFITYNCDRKNTKLIFWLMSV